MQTIFTFRDWPIVFCYIALVTTLGVQFSPEELTSWRPRQVGTVENGQADKTQARCYQRARAYGRIAAPRVSKLSIATDSAAALLTPFPAPQYTKPT